MRLKPIVTALCAGALLAASLLRRPRAESDWRDGGRPCQPFFVQITKGRSWRPAAGGDNVKVTLVSSGYDLGQQVAQIDNFIAAKVDMIILNAADSRHWPGGEAGQRGRDRGGGR